MSIPPTLSIIQNNIFMKKLLEKDPFNIQYIKEPTEQQCIDAFYNNKDVFPILPIQNLEICKEAINYKSEYFKFVKEQTLELNKFAIQKDPFLLEHVIDQNDSICKLALKLNINTFKLIRNQTEEICKYVINQNPFMIKYIINQTDELCYQTIIKNIDCIKYITNPNSEICLYVILMKPEYIQYIKNPSIELCKLAIDKDSNLYFTIVAVDEENIDLNEYVFKKYPIIFSKLYYKSDSACNIALKLDGLNIRYIKDPSEDMCKIAINQNITAIEFINNPTYEIYKYVHSIDNIYLKNKNILFDFMFDNIIKKEMDDCPICSENKINYVNFECHSNHIICIDCVKKSQTCYYRCNTNISYKNYFINTKLNN